MFPLCLALALVGQTPKGDINVGPVAVDKAPVWQIAVGQPDSTDRWFGFEYLGHFDDRNKFVYNRTRLHAPTTTGALNYGLDARGLTGTPTGVRGNDPAMQRRIDDAVDAVGVGVRKFEAGGVKPCGTIHAGECPGPNCPTPAKPKPDEPWRLPDPFEKRRDPWDHLVPVLITVAATGIVVGGTLILIAGVAYLVLRKQPPSV